MKKYVYLGMLFSMIVPVVPAFANMVCTGTVSYLGEDAGGTVAIGLNSKDTNGSLQNGVKICNTNTDVSGVTASACKEWYATLLASKVSGQTVGIYFMGSPTCSSVPPWSDAATIGQVYFVAAQ
jgi:hypothetical protein